jgi:hypothetical protein
MKNKLAIALVAGTVLGGSLISGNAAANGVNLSLSVGVPAYPYAAPPPVYYAPPAYYYPPQPVYYAPRAYYAPPAYYVGHPSASMADECGTDMAIAAGKPSLSALVIRRNV